MDSNTREEQGLCGLRQFYGVLVRGMVLVCIILVLVVGKLAFEAGSHFRRAEQAISEGDRDEALWQFQRAVRKYVPGLPTNRRAIERIEEMAADWSAAGDAERGENALKSLRATLYAIRSIYQPFPDVLRRTEESLGLTEISSGGSPTALGP